MSMKAQVDLAVVARRLEALGKPVRLSIFRLLVRAGADGRTVGQIQQALDIPSSTLSFHIRRLVEVGLVNQERAGTTLICHADDAVMDSTLGFLLRECCQDEATEASPRIRQIE